MAAHVAPSLPRLRQAVIAAHDLDHVVGQLRDELGLGEPFADPGVEHFGLRNAVFALGDSFLEVVSPIRADTAAGRLLERRGGDCGYMTMFQVEDLAAARERVRSLGVREVFEVSLDDVEEVHLHPADMRGAIVSLTTPRPPSAWRWGGPGWQERSAPLRITGATITVAEPATVGDRWATALGAPLERVGVQVSADEEDRGLVEVRVSRFGGGDSFTAGGVQFVIEQEEAQ
ncbi:MAG TPA: VOC family protein [Solirubrobacteraceae bacterium]|nr:VOC family protein [Solirubrobacteraceae bacterium]